MRWTQMKIMHRGVQAPGYVDPLTKRFIFVKEMVPEIIVPNLEGCEVRNRNLEIYSNREKKVPGLFPSITM